MPRYAGRLGAVFLRGDPVLLQRDGINDCPIVLVADHPAREALGTGGVVENLGADASVLGIVESDMELLPARGTASVYGSQRFLAVDFNAVDLFPVHESSVKRGSDNLEISVLRVAKPQYALAGQLLRPASFVRRPAGLLGFDGCRFPLLAGPVQLAVEVF